jgi:23S rRNA (uracil1939-C5)-methyltransferase
MSRRRPDQPKPPPILETLVIERLGAQGDGIAESRDGPVSNGSVFVPFALPGETVRAETRAGRARLMEVLTPSPERHPPRCAHYTVCGGCSLQHLNDAPYLAFKRDAVRAALASRGLDVEVAPAIAVPPRTRRRATFSADRRGTKTARVGFHGARSHDLVPITDCAVMTRGLLALIPKLERLAQIAAPTSGGIVITATETLTGFDVALTGVGKWFSADDRLRLTQEAAAQDVARISIDGETILEMRPPALRAGAASLTPPPGGFLQAAAPAEAAMVKLVEEATAGAGYIADLFAGSGTFTLPLASRARVHAAESDQPALAALQRAVTTAPGLKPVTTEPRDLFRRPLTEAELNRFDAVILDPPRAGAEAQCARLAASKVKRVAYVSCSPATLARDLRTLVDGGYSIDAVTPIDQFLWSPHVEAVAVLSR